MGSYKGGWVYVNPEYSNKSSLALVKLRFTLAMKSQLNKMYGKEVTKMYGKGAK